MSKKLSKKQSELNAMAASLGADFRYLSNVFPHHIVPYYLLFCLSGMIPAERAEYNAVYCTGAFSCSIQFH